MIGRYGARVQYGARERYGPWALVAGASDGIGASFASALAARGLDVVLVARRQAALEQLAAEIRAAHRVVVRTIVADLGTPAGLDTVLESTEDIGLLVCNAASAPVAAFLELSTAQIDAMLDLNCRAAARLTHALGNRMVARGRGGVILLSSVAGNQGVRRRHALRGDQGLPARTGRRTVVRVAATRRRRPRLLSRPGRHTNL